jgi:biotin carboxyl carrier protein
VTIDLALGGRRFRASVRATGGVLRVVLAPLDDLGDTIERVVEVHQNTAMGYSIRLTPDGRVVAGTVVPSPAGAGLVVQLSHLDVEVSVNGRHQAVHEATGAASGEQRVCAPMPGRVLRVLVETGATVVTGQALVVIEAMKMENALTAVRDGVVHEVAVVEGDSVEAGRLLLRVG